jgi:hypothetical protein
LSIKKSKSNKDISTGIALTGLPAENTLVRTIWTGRMWTGELLKIIFIYSGELINAL